MFLSLSNTYTNIMCIQTDTATTQALFQADALIQSNLTSAAAERNVCSCIMLDFVYISLQIQGAFFPFSSRGRKSIGRIMMLLSVLLPQLYIHCHQFTTQPLELNPDFYSSALLFICNSCRCGGERTHVCV